MPSASSEVSEPTRAISRLICCTSSSSSWRRMMLDASSPIITIRMATLRRPGIFSSLALIFTIEPAPDHLRHRGGVFLRFGGDVFLDHFSLLGLEQRQLKMQQRFSVE